MKNFLETLSFRNFRKKTNHPRIENDVQRAVNRGLLDYIVELEKQIMQLQSEIDRMKKEKENE